MVRQLAAGPLQVLESPVSTNQCARVRGRIIKLKHRKGTTDDLDRPDIKESPIRSFFVAEKLVHDELALSKSSVGNAKNRDDNIN